jgi:hypothetical protein
VLYWFTAGYLEKEKDFRRIMKYEHRRVLNTKPQEFRELRLERLQSTSTIFVDNTTAIPVIKEVAQGVWFIKRVTVKFLFALEPHLQVW